MQQKESLLVQFVECHLVGYDEDSCVWRLPTSYKGYDTLEIMQDGRVMIGRDSQSCNREIKKEFLAYDDTNSGNPTSIIISEESIVAINETPNEMCAHAEHALECLLRELSYLDDDIIKRFAWRVRGVITLDSNWRENHKDAINNK